MPRKNGISGRNKILRVRLGCTGSWGTQIHNSTKKIWKKCQLGKVLVGKVPVGEVSVRGSASWGTEI